MWLFDRFKKTTSPTQIVLPKAVKKLADTTKSLRKEFGTTTGFAPSGAIIGGIGEHEVCRAFGLDRARIGMAGFDAIASDGRTVQVKSTQGSGASFSYHETGADHLICIDLDLQKRIGTIIYNGPEAPVRAILGTKPWSGTFRVSRATLLKLDAAVSPSDRLGMIL